MMRVSVRTEVLEAALRGGEPAKQLAAECAARREKSDAALAAMLENAPDVIAESRERSDTLRVQKEELSADLDTLSASLDDLVGTSERISSNAKVAAEKLKALDDLAELLEPMVVVSTAISGAEEGDHRDVAGLQEILRALEEASRISSESDSQQLRKALPILQDHVSETTEMMQVRFLDLVEITGNRISARSHLAKAGSSNGEATSPADALAKAGLLEEALRAIVTKLTKTGIASGLRSATVFFASSTTAGDGPSLEWTSGEESSGELLEFQPDDLEDVPDQDTDIMAECLDIANAASRALAVFDILRDHVVGEAHSAALAEAFHPWLCEHILAVSSVMTSFRAAYREIGIPPDALRARVLAISASARVLQGALHSRGADPSVFAIKIDSSEIESTVASECRAMAVLSARRAIGTFAEARHNNSKLTPCPLSAHDYVPRAERTSDYFPPCIVSQSAATVLDVFSSTRMDAMQAISGGSAVVGKALMAAAFECVDAYRMDVPLQHGDEMRSSLRLKALYYNDCMMLKFACQQADEKDREEAGNLSAPPSADMLQVSGALGKAAEAVMLSMRRTAEKGLIDNLNSACRNGALGAYGTLTRIQRSSALIAAYNAIRELVEVFAETIPTEIAELAAASLCEKYLRKLCDAVVELEEILPNGCEQIDSILGDAGNNCAQLMALVKGAADVRQGVEAPEIVNRLALQNRRAEAYRHVVTARMEDIVNRFREGKYGDAVDRAQVEAFLLKIFEDTELRAAFIRELDVSPEAEKEEWGDTDW